MDILLLIDIDYLSCTFCRLTRVNNIRVRADCGVVFRALYLYRASNVER